MPLTPTPTPCPASFWRAEPHKLDRHRSTHQLPATADIVIVGGGFAGASIAHHLLSKSESAPVRPSILILEARDACSGATGRNGAYRIYQQYTFQNRIDKSQVAI
jgi:monoamine oxidase